MRERGALTGQAPCETGVATGGASGAGLSRTSPGAAGSGVSDSSSRERGPRRGDPGPDQRVRGREPLTPRPPGRRRPRSRCSDTDARRCPTWLPLGRTRSGAEGNAIEVRAPGPYAVVRTSQTRPRRLRCRARNPLVTSPCTSGNRSNALITVSHTTTCHAAWLHLVGDILQGQPSARDFPPAQVADCPSGPPVQPAAR